MLEIEYLYLGGPYDGEWRVPCNQSASGREPERYVSESGKPGRYVPTKFGHMATFGEGEFRMTCHVMLEESYYETLIGKINATDARLGYAQRLERALTMRAFREHLQRTWRTPELIEFGPAWEAMERRPAWLAERPIRDRPQA